MKLKLLSIILAVVLIAVPFSSCGKNSDGAVSSNGDDGYSMIGSSSVQETAKPETYYNSLTGCEVEGSADKADLRPVAVMINNLNKAQAVQTGLADASIVYETFVEGGITRLLAVFKDIASVGELGSVRSARYSYVDLANGHDALYLHCGLDSTYCGPYMKELKVDDIDLNTGVFGNYGYRVNNGLAKEHTMYTTGEKIAAAMQDKDRRTTKSSSKASLYEPWQNFADESETVTLTGGAANNISVYFSNSYVTGFKYDASTGRYIKSNKSGNNTDYRTGDSLSYKNVLVLFTSVGNFADGYRVYSKLESGSGYYITNGTYTKIKWSKGKTDAPLKITDESGNAVKYSAGNSYVCIASKDTQSKTTIE